MVVPKYVRRYYVPGYDGYYSKDENDNKSVFFFLYKNLVYSEPSNIQLIFMHFIYSLSREELEQVNKILEGDNDGLVKDKKLQPAKIYGELMEPGMDYIDGLFQVKKLMLVTDYEKNGGTGTLGAYKKFVKDNGITLDPDDYDPELYKLLQLGGSKFGKRRSYAKTTRRNRRSRRKIRRRRSY